MGMPDDHSNCIVTFITDDDYEYTQVTDVSDINFGKDMDDDIETILNPPKREHIIAFH